MKLIDSYRKPNGEVDINKAIGENPKNELLREYKNIISEMGSAADKARNKEGTTDNSSGKE